MDPDKLLKDMREIANDIDTGDGHPYDRDRLAELVLSLDEWLTKGGFLPKRWAKGWKRCGQ